MKITTDGVLRRIKNFPFFHFSRLLAPDSWLLIALMIALLGAIMMATPLAGWALEIQWLGTAGFSLRSGQKTLLIDPYFTRNERARPPQLHCP